MKQIFVSRLVLLGMLLGLSACGGSPPSTSGTASTGEQVQITAIGSAPYTRGDCKITKDGSTVFQGEVRSNPQYPNSGTLVDPANNDKVVGTIERNEDGSYSFTLTDNSYQQLPGSATVKLEG